MYVALRVKYKKLDLHLTPFSVTIYGSVNTRQGEYIQNKIFN